MSWSLVGRLSAGRPRGAFAALTLVAVLSAGCSLVQTAGGSPTPGDPGGSATVRADMNALRSFMEQNTTPWTAIGLTRDGLTITTGRGDSGLEARARALVTTPLTFEYANGAGPVPMSPLPIDPSLIQIPTSPEFGGCHLMPGLYGTLVPDDRWVLALRPDSGQPWAGEVIKIYWPDQWTARRDSDRLVLLDAMREVVAAAGDPLVIGGGRQYADGYLACNVARAGESGRWLHQSARQRAAV